MTMAEHRVRPSLINVSGQHYRGRSSNSLPARFYATSAVAPSIKRVMDKMSVSKISSGWARPDKRYGVVLHTGFSSRHRHSDVPNADNGWRIGSQQLRL